MPEKAQHGAMMVHKYIDTHSECEINIADKTRRTILHKVRRNNNNSENNNNNNSNINNNNSNVTNLHTALSLSSNTPTPPINYESGSNETVVGNTVHTNNNNSNQINLNFDDTLFETAFNEVMLLIQNDVWRGFKKTMNAVTG